jgi:hypothetical protein
VRRFAPEPGDTVDVTALRVFSQTSWTPQHRAGWRQDPLAKLSTLMLGVGAMMLFISILGLVGLWIYTTVM